MAIRKKANPLADKAAKDAAQGTAAAPTTVYDVNSNHQTPVYSIPKPAAIDPNRAATLNPTLTHDLQYFHALASGASQHVESNTGAPASLVLNLFRATETWREPVAERITLGQAAGAPYYALHATPSTLSVNEFNTLQITRRHPITAVYDDACHVEIQPMLALNTPGGKLIAKMRRGEERFFIIWSDIVDGMAAGQDEVYALWKEPGLGDNGNQVLLAQVYTEGNPGWRTLDEPGRGGIRARKPVPIDNGPSGAPRFASPRSPQAGDTLAYLDATKQWPQFVSSSGEAHLIMDVLAATFLTVAIAETRKVKQIAAANKAQYYQQNGMMYKVPGY